MDWSKYPNFTPAEFACQHTGKHGMCPEFMAKLQALRSEYGKPMRVTSGFRHPTHPIEARKREPGQHAHGRAVDIACHASGAYEIVRLAFKHGFTGIGVSQRDGVARFVHLDARPGPVVLYGY